MSKASLSKQIIRFSNKTFSIQFIATAKHCCVDAVIEVNYQRSSDRHPNQRNFANADTQVALFENLSDYIRKTTI